MTASYHDWRSASRRRGRKPAPARHYMIAPAALGVTRQALVDRLSRLGNIEILRTYAELPLTSSPPIAVVRMSDEAAAALHRYAVALRRSTAGAFIIEPDRYLRASSFAGVSPKFQPKPVMSVLGPGLAVAIRVLSENGEPVEQAEVRTPRGAGVSPGTDRQRWQGRSDAPRRTAGDGHRASRQRALRLLGPLAASARPSGQRGKHLYPGIIVAV